LSAKVGFGVFDRLSGHDEGKIHRHDVQERGVRFDQANFDGLCVRRFDAADLNIAAFHEGFAAINVAQEAQAWTFRGRVEGPFEAVFDVFGDQFASVREAHIGAQLEGERPAIFGNRWHGRRDAWLELAGAWFVIQESIEQHFAGGPALWVVPERRIERGEIVTVGHDHAFLAPASDLRARGLRASDLRASGLRAGSPGNQDKNSQQTQGSNPSSSRLAICG
jgi:hypothetical protein